MTSGRGLLAFDPGVSGGWAWLAPNSDDMSVYAWRTETEFLEFLDPINPAGYTAIVEDVPAYVSSMTSNASSFKLGYNFGFLVGALRARRFPVELVKPREWQKGLRGLKPKMGYTDRKRTIKDNAARLYPGLKITNANADAVMIMDWKLNRDAWALGSSILRNDNVLISSWYFMITADGFDSCLIGKDSKDRAIYDADAMIETLVVRDDMTHEDAVDYFWYNIDGAYVGEDTPIYVFLNYER